MNRLTKKLLIATLLVFALLVGSAAACRCEITACKVDDEGEPIAGWGMTLSQWQCVQSLPVNVQAATLRNLGSCQYGWKAKQTQKTLEDGCYTFVVGAGTFGVGEEERPGWVPVGETFVNDMVCTVNNPSFSHTFKNNPPPSVPEFPTFAVSGLMLVGMLGAVLYLRERR